MPDTDRAPETRPRLLLREHGIAEVETGHRIVAPDGTEVLPGLAGGGTGSGFRAKVGA